MRRPPNYEFQHGNTAVTVQTQQDGILLSLTTTTGQPFETSSTRAAVYVVNRKHIQAMRDVLDDYLKDASKTCLNCKALFNATRQSARYCSERCRGAYKKRQQRAKLKLTLLD